MAKNKERDKELIPLAANEVYIGHGHRSHRQPTSKWASPFIAGQHGTVEDCLIKVAAHTGDTGNAGNIG